MKNWHKEILTTDDTHVDFSASVPVTELLKLFEIATFKHSNEMGLDHVSMQKENNAFWDVTKLKVLNKAPICVNEKIKITTWTHELGTIRAIRDCVIKSANTVKAKFVAEWCCLDFDTRKIRRLSTINYPDLEMEKTDCVETEFSNIREEVDETNFVYSRVVRSTDIDVNNHVNNLKYNFMALDSFSVDELKSFKIVEYEIYFVNESYLNDKIDIYKKKVKNGFYVEGKVEDKTIFKVFMKTKKRV
jgi:acyl-ACP thioesterase